MQSSIFQRNEAWILASNVGLPTEYSLKPKGSSCLLLQVSSYCLSALAEQNKFPRSASGAAAALNGKFAIQLKLLLSECADTMFKFSSV